MFNISVDQYILPDGTSSQTTLRRNIDVLLNDLDDQDLIVIEYTLKGIIESKNINQAYFKIWSSIIQYNFINNKLSGQVSLYIR